MLVGSPKEPSQRNYMVFQPSDPAEDPATASTYCQKWEWAVLLMVPNFSQVTLSLCIFPNVAQTS